MHETKFAKLKAPRTPAYNLSAPDHHWLVSSQQPLAVLDEGTGYQSRTVCMMSLVVVRWPCTITPARCLRTEESDEMFRRRWRALQSVDEMIGEIVQTLEELKQLDQTVIIYTADHGASIWFCKIPSGRA
eukprot:SAG11_NODE_1078_length_5963_cov_5.690825_3_plen_130_part_00